MQRLFSEGDYERTASYFIDYYRSSQGGAKDSLEEHVQPGARQGDAVQNGNQNEKFWNLSDIYRIQDKYARMPAHRMTPAERQEAEALDAEITAALVQNRIIEDVPRR